MCRYRITTTGRLIDSVGHDLEPEEYLTFHTSDPDDSSGVAPGGPPMWREYRARFSAGPLQNIVRVDADCAQSIRYGLASFRWFNSPSFLFDDGDDAPETTDSPHT
jgi:hypothetical protein